MSKSSTPPCIALTTACGGPLGAIDDHEDPSDTQLYLANTLGDWQRRYLADHVHQQTRAMLRERGATLAPKPVRHGITLRDDAPPERRHRLASVPQLEAA
jgi:hypothetical protein